ncbi:thioredoxin-like fold domain-containing protein MRL7 homolog, chloroplastic [Aristolochia californica]|uniref:thioredoxin-like fold domain-containing protein MRL7 homolog, chloroplastic n=1 Tax=Aristolochia californica TaxID=171875 RepID=UPI0035D8B76B
MSLLLQTNFAQRAVFSSSCSKSPGHIYQSCSSHGVYFFRSRRSRSSHHLLVSVSASSDSNPPDPQPRGTNPRQKPKVSLGKTEVSDKDKEKDLLTTKPRKPRRGRRSEAAAVEDFVRDSLERTFSEIRKQGSGVLDDKGEVLKSRAEERDEGEDDDDDDDREGKRDKGKKQMVEEDDPDWPLDADVGWGIRASEYFEKHSIKNVVENGVEIDWEGELDDSWIKEINCLEWESFAFHPSPLIVLVFERYNRATENWKLLKELEKAFKVYWKAKDRLPPRTVKIDINIERDLAYALRVKECPQLLFLRGNKVLYREKEIRTADELVQMIAHFYYNAKKPLWIDDAAVAPKY